MSYEPCIFSPESVADCSLTSFSDTSQLSLLSGSHTHAESYGSDLLKDGSQGCTCGKEMSDCLIHPSTPEKWIASMRDSLAKTLASLESRQVYLREPDQVFTEKSCVLLASFGPATCSWRTLQQSFLTDSEPFSQTWPRWGMTRITAVLERQMWERPTIEIDGSLTQKGFDYVNTDKRIPVATLRILQHGNGSAKIQWEWSFRGFYEIYESEILQSCVCKSAKAKRISDKESISLEGEKTPRKLLRSMFEHKEFTSASHGQGCSEQRPTELDDSLRELSQHLALEGEEGEWNLYTEVKAYAHPMSERRITETDGFCWPTPSATEHTGGGSAKAGIQAITNQRRPSGATMSFRLRDAVKVWQTPTTNDAKNSTLPESQRFRNGMAGALMREGVKAGGQLNPNWVSWLMNFPIGFAATHDIMGFNSKESKNANAKEGNADSALCELRKSSGEETIQFAAGGLDRIQEKEVLRSSLHGESNDPRESDVSRAKASFYEVSSEEMQRLWDAGEFADTPHGQQPGEQRAGELEDTLRFMSCEMALGKREGLVEAIEEMQTLRKASEEERALQHPCKPNVQARESANGSWWDTEPNIGRVAKGVPNRVGQLKGYGNAQVPLQAAAAWTLLHG